MAMAENGQAHETTDAQDASPHQHRYYTAANPTTHHSHARPSTESQSLT